MAGSAQTAGHDSNRWRRKKRGTSQREIQDTEDGGSGGVTWSDTRGRDDGGVISRVHCAQFFYLYIATLSTAMIDRRGDDHMLECLARQMTKICLER